jgi:site-specific DNA-methyltransferase (adenine-specific)
MARKPLIGTVAANVLAHGTGALNIDASRVDRRNAQLAADGYRPSEYQMGETTPSGAVGRFPANLIHDGSDEVIAAFPDAKGQQGRITGDEPSDKTGEVFGVYAERAPSTPRADVSPSAARFFYCAKTSKSDRNEGCGALPERSAAECVNRKEGSAGMNNPRAGANSTSGAANIHPTVKPNALMRYLVRMVTPPSGTVFDPFTGSGSTGKAAMQEGFQFKGCELSAEYAAIAAARISCA